MRDELHDRIQEVFRHPRHRHIPEIDEIFGALIAIINELSDALDDCEQHLPTPPPPPPPERLTLEIVPGAPTLKTF